MDSESEKITSDKKIDKKRSHACDVCGMRFKSTSNLNSHKMIHTGEKPY